MKGIVSFVNFRINIVIIQKNQNAFLLPSMHVWCVVRLNYGKNISCSIQCLHPIQYVYTRVVGS